MQRRVQIATADKHRQARKYRQHAAQDENEDLVTSMQVDVEEAATGPRGRARSNRHRIVRQLQQTDDETEGEEKDGENDSGATPAAPQPEPMKITLDLNFKEVVGGNGDITTAALEGEPPVEVSAFQQHRTLILGVALSGGIVLLALAFTFFRQANLWRQQQQQQQQQQLGGTGATLEASPHKKRPVELHSVTAAGGVGNPTSPSTGRGGGGDKSMSGRLAGERAAGSSSSSKNKIMVREESRIDSSRAPNTGRGDFFQLKEIDLGVQSPGRGGPGSKVFSPRG